MRVSKNRKKSSFSKFENTKLFSLKVTKKWYFVTKIVLTYCEKKTFLAFKNWVKSIQTAGYNGARTVCILRSHNNLKKYVSLCILFDVWLSILKKGQKRVFFQFFVAFSEYINFKSGNFVLAVLDRIVCGSKRKTHGIQAEVKLFSHISKATITRVRKESNWQ